MLHPKTLEQMRLLVAELDPDDGVPARQRRRMERRQDSHTARQRRLCGQVARALTLALPTAYDTRLSSLVVVEVVPDPDLRRLELRLAAPPGAHQEGLVAILGACLAGFGLGVTFERRQREGQGPQKTLPPGALIFPSRSPAATPSKPPRPFGSAVPPQARAGWQLRLHEAGEERLAKGRWEDAEAFFRRAAAVLPRGPLAGSARAGAAEALIRQDKRGQAREELELLRRELHAGLVPGGAPVLQRVAELAAAAGD